MPTYEHECTLCDHQWEDIYSMSTPPPTTCPACGKEGAKRVIALTAKGKVELTGQDLISKVKSDARQIHKESGKNEYLKANLIGEEKFKKMVE